MSDVYMGTMPTRWMASKKIKTITFSVTDDCNLACTYCYFTHKNSINHMDIITAKKAVDYILSERTFSAYDGVIWEFIGGEPTLEIDLIFQICDYIVETMFLQNHKWLYCYKFMIGTNGLLYSSLKVQNLIKRHNINLNISITIDGSRRKHDLSRIKKDGSGSYDLIVKQVPLWKLQQGAFSTKSTFAHADLPFLKESIISLWNLGIHNVLANIVFEDCWKENDDLLFEKQLKDLADYVIDNQLWNKFSVRFFDPSIGHPISSLSEGSNFCGVGKMLAINWKGDFYPCVRFMETALDGQNGLVVGNIDSGIDFDRLRPFYSIDTISQSNESCLNCEVASGCAWCSGNNYYYTKEETIFERKTYLCKMHQANVRAAEYFWKNFEKTTGQISPMRRIRIQNKSRHQKYLYILLSSEFQSICQYNNTINENVEMSENMIFKAINFCFDHHIIPIFVGRNAEKYSDFGLVTSNSNIEIKGKARVISTEEIEKEKSIEDTSIIFVTQRKDLRLLSQRICQLTTKLKPCTNINLFFSDLHAFNKNDLHLYKKQLNQISGFLYELWKQGNQINLNVLTHFFYKDVNGACESGIRKIALAPDGFFYLCPALYYDASLQRKYRIGNLENDIDNPFESLCDTNKNSACRTCDTSHCPRCIYLNKKLTGEFCVPPEIECLKSSIERSESYQLFCRLKNDFLLDQRFKPNISAYFHGDLLSERSGLSKYHLGELDE